VRGAIHHGLGGDAAQGAGAGAISGGPAHKVRNAAWHSASSVSVLCALFSCVQCCTCQDVTQNMIGYVSMKMLI
jgi:hypothetical protein